MGAWDRSRVKGSGGARSQEPGGARVSGCQDARMPGCKVARSGGGVLLRRGGGAAFHFTNARIGESGIVVLSNKTVGFGYEDNKLEL